MSENFTNVLEKMSNDLNTLSSKFDESRESLIRIEENMKNLQTIQADVKDHAKDITSLQNQTVVNSSRLDKLENNQTWLWRTVGTAVILAVLSTVIMM